MSGCLYVCLSVCFAGCLPIFAFVCFLCIIALSINQSIKISRPRPSGKNSNLNITVFVVNCMYNECMIVGRNAGNLTVFQGENAFSTILLKFILEEWTQFQLLTY